MRKRFIKTLLPFLAVLTSALWLGAIAILAIQNYALVSLAIASFPLFNIPVGILLAFCVIVGMLGAVLLQGVVSKE